MLYHSLYADIVNFIQYFIFYGMEQWSSIISCWVFVTVHGKLFAVKCFRDHQNQFSGNWPVRNYWNILLLNPGVLKYDRKHCKADPPEALLAEYGLLVVIGVSFCKEVILFYPQAESIYFIWPRTEEIFLSSFSFRDFKQDVSSHYICINELFASGMLSHQARGSLQN